MRLILLFTSLVVVSCLEQDPIPSTTTSSDQSITAEFHNSNEEPYVIYRKFDTDGRFTREATISANQMISISDFNPEFTYIIRASRLNMGQEGYEFEWEIKPEETKIFISF